MPRVSLAKGQFVQLSPVGGGLVVARHRIGLDQVLVIAEVLHLSVYGRKAYVVRCGQVMLVVWPSQVVKVRHPKTKRRKKHAAAKLG